MLAEHPHRFTVDEYLHLDVDRTELIEGTVYDVSPESALHAVAVAAIRAALDAGDPGRWTLDTGSVRMGDGSLWDPDVYVVERVDPLPDYFAAESVLTVVEVAVSSAHRDLGSKLRAYAAVGIAEYWIVDPHTPGWAIHHWNPEGDRYTDAERVELPGGYHDLTTILAELYQ